MSWGHNAKYIGTGLLHVFVSSSQIEDHFEKRSCKDTPQNVDVLLNKRVDPVDPAVTVCEDEMLNENSPVGNSVCYNQGTLILRFLKSPISKKAMLPLRMRN